MRYTILLPLIAVFLLLSQHQQDSKEPRLDPSRIERFHREFTSKIRLAGSEACLRAADQVAAQFRAAGLDVEEEEFEVWLSRPVKASLKLEGDKKVLPLTEKGFEWDRDSFNGKEVLPHLGYSVSGKVKAHVVYVNYGLPQDYAKLDEFGIDVHGKIVIVRYGKSFRGVKLEMAEKHGAVAILIYSDPADDGFVKGDPYPRGRMRPETGVQRGSALYIFQYPGDPLTPGQPAVQGVKRLRREAAKSLPKLPALPLSWGTAKPILESLGDPAVPAGWQGGLPFTYHIGPGHKKLEMEVLNKEESFVIRNVFGVLEGKSGKKGDFVLFGNHRDSWVNGAIDAGTGLAIMLELATTMGEKAKNGWLPDYTIRFASWDGEEYGIIGSVEYGEKHETFLKEHLIAYLNADAPITGAKFGTSCTPELRSFVKELAGKIKHPDRGTMLAESWDGKTGALGGGSDFMVFLDRFGTPCLQFSMSGASGVYHSAFDTHWFVKNRIDPGFRYHICLTGVYREALYQLSAKDSDAWSPGEFLLDIKKRVEELRDSLPEKEREELLAPIPDMLKRMNELVANKSVSRRALSLLGQSWINEDGLFGRPWFRNLYIAPGRYTGYAASICPGLSEAVQAKDAGRIKHELTRLTAQIMALSTRMGELAER